MTARPNKNINPETGSVDIKKIALKIVVDEENAPDRIYSNHIRVSHSPFDFTLDFCDLSAITEDTVTEHENYAEVKVKPKVRIALTPSILEALIPAIKNNLDSFNKLNEELRKDE